MKYLRFALAVLPALAAMPALAHTGVGHTHGFIQGFQHPISGLDHSVAMIAVGLFASLLAGRALWSVPATFVMMMLVGGGLGIAGVEMPAVELGITLSIIVIGAVTALGLRWPTTAATALVGFFAIFHGYAHGAEMPLGASALGYSLGFALATSLLHVAGVAVGLLTRQCALVRIGGVAASLWGVAPLIG
jgi:urease accessory protein